MRFFVGSTKKCVSKSIGFFGAVKAKRLRMSIIECRVRGCRHKFSHTTLGHECGNCHQYGHGQLECGWYDRIRRLRNLSFNDIIPNDECCKINNCIMPYTHYTSTHESGGYLPRSQNKITTKCPTCRAVSSVDLSLCLNTGNECIVCMTNNDIVVFSACKHANVCATCVTKL